MSTVTLTPATIQLTASGPKTPQTSTKEVLAEEQPSSAQYIHDVETYSVEGMPTHPVVMVRGQGEFLWDLEGKQYIDFNAGFSSCNQGHCHPKIVDAMMKQCQILAMPSRSVHVPGYAMFCKRLCELTGYDKAALMNGGAEGTDMAIKLARSWGYKVKGIETNKAMVLTAVENYHGRGLGLLSASSDDHYRDNAGPFMPNVGPYCTGEPIRFGVVEDLERAFQKCGPQIAGFMVEPVQGHAGCIPASDEYLVEIRRLCTKYNVLLIADEIQAGLGRAGSFLSFQTSGIKPDMVVLGKSLSGGMYPISGVLGTNEVMTSIKPGQYGSTFSGNPLACAVGLAALDVILDNDLPARSAELGEIFQARLRAIKSPYFDTVTGKGLFVSIYIHETHPQGRVTGKRLAALCLERGLIVNSAGRRLRICPALVIDKEVMLKGVDILEKALDDLPNLEL
ncbi:putative ornithine aminotransferase [Hypoxylon cercidicola]|nr:putative ornithine aminotransferase [Hypoxylon cercidicola]